MTREFIRSNDPVVKVGFTKDPIQRMSAYPNESEYICVCKTHDAYGMEQRVLSAFRDAPHLCTPARNIGTEWFRANSPEHVTSLRDSMLMMIILGKMIDKPIPQEVINEDQEDKLIPGDPQYALTRYYMTVLRPRYSDPSLSVKESRISQHDLVIEVNEWAKRQPGYDGTVIRTKLAEKVLRGFGVKCVQVRDSDLRDIERKYKNDDEISKRQSEDADITGLITPCFQFKNPERVAVLEFVRDCVIKMTEGHEQEGKPLELKEVRNVLSKRYGMVISDLEYLTQELDWALGCVHVREKFCDRNKRSTLWLKYSLRPEERERLSTTQSSNEETIKWMTNKRKRRTSENSSDEEEDVVNPITRFIDEHVEAKPDGGWFTLVDAKSQIQRQCRDQDGRYLNTNFIKKELERQLCPCFPQKKIAGKKYRSVFLGYSLRPCSYDAPQKTLV